MPTRQYLQFELSYAAKFELKYSNSITAELELPSIKIISAGIVSVKIDLSLVGELNGSIEYFNTLSGSIGVKAEHKGIKYFSIDNISKQPKSESKFECKADTFIGLKIEPNVKIKVVALKSIAKISAKVGVRAKVANNDPYTDTALGRIHECQVCFEGDISAELSISCEVSFRDWKKSRSFGPFSIKITDFHYSQTFNEFGFTKCGHCQYRLAVEVYDENGSPIKYASIKCGGGEGTTNEDGIATMFSKRGEQVIHISAYGYIDSDTTINIDAPKQTAVTLYKIPDLGDNKKNVFNYNGHSYCVFNNVVDTIDDAITYCHKLGGYLLVINDAEENDYVYEKMTAQGIDSAYFGYTDQYSEGSWGWLDRSSAYKNWASGEPNGGKSENYAMFYYKYPAGTWNDGKFGIVKAFICEWDYKIIPDDTAQVTPKPVSRKHLPNIDTDANALNVMENGAEIDTDTISESYSELIPNEIYNFYLVKSKEADSVISSDNLLYITQAAADENGDLTMNYAPVNDEPNAEKLLVGMNGTDISKAKVTVEDLRYTGEEQFCKVNVIYDGQELAKGKDYYVCNDFIAKECGDYSVFIEGCGEYSGGITAEYKVISDDNEGISSSENGTDISDNTTTTTITATATTTKNNLSTVTTSAKTVSSTTTAAATTTTTTTTTKTTTTAASATTTIIKTTTTTSAATTTTTKAATTTTITKAAITTTITVPVLTNEQLIKNADVNDDGEIDAIDSSKVLSSILGQGELPEGKGDANGDGKIDIIDAMAAMEYHARISTDSDVSDFFTNLSKASSIMEKSVTISQDDASGNESDEYCEFVLKIDSEQPVIAAAAALLFNGKTPAEAGIKEIDITSASKKYGNYVNLKNGKFFLYSSLQNTIAKDSIIFRVYGIKAGEYAISYDDLKFYGTDGTEYSGFIKKDFDSSLTVNATSSENKKYLGDVDGNDIIDAVDASKILAKYAKYSIGSEVPTEDDLAICDVNKDGYIDAVDASKVLAYYAHTSTGGKLAFEEFMKNK